MMKKMLCVCLSLLLSLSMIACGKTADESANTVDADKTTDAAGTQENKDPADGTQTPEVTEIAFWHHMEGTNADALENVCRTFNETVGADYGIVVVPSFQGTNTAEKLNTLAQAGDWRNFPDLCQVASAGIPVIYGYDLLVTPEEMYEKGENIILDRDDIIANNARTFTYKDELCAMPFSNSTILLYYNKDLFEAAGLDAAAPPATLDELAAAVERLTVKDGDDVSTYGLNVEVKRYQLVNWIGGQGEYNFIGDNEGGRAGLMSKVTFGEDGTLMNYLTEWEKVIQTGGYKAVEDNINEEFAMQISAMAIMSSARITKLEELIEDSFEWGTAPLPTVNADDQGGTAVGGSGLVMFDHEDSARLDAAWIFMQYLGGEEAQFDFCTASGYIPMNKSLYETEKMKNYMEENDKIVAAVDQLMSSHPYVQEPFDMVTSEINSIVNEEMLDFADGVQDKQATHDNIVNKCNEKLENYVSVNAD